MWKLRPRAAACCAQGRTVFNRAVRARRIRGRSTVLEPFLWVLLAPSRRPWRASGHLLLIAGHDRAPFSEEVQRNEKRSVDQDVFVPRTGALVQPVLPSRALLAVRYSTTLHGQGAGPPCAVRVAAELNLGRESQPRHRLLRDLGMPLALLAPRLAPL